MKHSVSYYRLNGDHWINPHEHEDLLQVLLSKERFVVDTNASWKNETKKPENRDKAFIIGMTLMAEQDTKLKGVFFNSKVDLSNNNIYIFDIDPDLGKEPLVVIERLDAPYRLTLDEARLAAESLPRDAEFLAQENDAIEGEKEQILNVLGVHSLEKIDREFYVRRTQELLAFIRQEAPRCVANYVNSYQVARRCYALLLLNEKKIRNEFALADYRHVFGDTMLIHNALFLQANVLSHDKVGVHNMMSYIGSPKMLAYETV
jgi:hypothetical protein